MQPQRPAATLLLSRRECLLAFPAAASLKDIKASRPTERKVQAISSAALVQMHNMPNLMPYLLQVFSTMAKLSQEELGKYSLEVVPQLSSRAPPAQLHSHTAQSYHPPSLLRTTHVMHMHAVQQCSIPTSSFVVENQPHATQVSCQRDPQERWLPLVGAESTPGLLILLP